MALPLAPIAGFALRYGAVALATYTVTRKIGPGFRDQRAEDALDDTPEGVTLHQSDDQANASARFRRVFRVGTDGPGIEIDATALGRIRVRRAK